jgi:hypothetical protein
MQSPSTVIKYRVGFTFPKGWPYWGLNKNSAAHCVGTCRETIPTCHPSGQAACEQACHMTASGNGRVMVLSQDTGTGFRVWGSGQTLSPYRPPPTVWHDFHWQGHRHPPAVQYITLCSVGAAMPQVAARCSRRVEVRRPSLERPVGSHRTAPLDGAEALPVVGGVLLVIRP